jgi:hypothetical protein
MRRIGSRCLDTMLDVAPFDEPPQSALRGAQGVQTGELTSEIPRRPAKFHGRFVCFQENGKGRTAAA